MAQDTSELVVAARGNIYVADVGTAFPTTPTATPAAGWVDLGLVTEDGVSFNRGITVEDFRAWQRLQPVRREITDETIGASFSLEQWNADSFTLAFGGGEVSEVSPGIYSYDFPSGEEELDERALLLRWEDHDRNYQLGFDRGTISDAVETTLARGSLAVLPLTFNALAAVDEETVGVSLLTDDPAFEPAGS